MTITWQNDCQVPTSGTPTNANTGTGTNIVNGGTNSALSTGQSVGAGNTFQVETTGLPTVTGLTIARCWQYVQAAANQLTEYADGTAAQSHFVWYSLFKLDAAPAASLTHLRLYTDNTHATIAFSAQITTTRKCHIGEQGGSTSTDSSGVLTAATWYCEKVEIDNATKTATITYFTLGSASIVAQSSFTYTGSYSIQSVRHGIGTASAFSSQGFHRCLIQMGDQTVARPDLANAAPVADAGPDQTVDPYDLVTLDGTRSFDTDGTVASYAWSQTSGTTVTLSSSSASQPTFTAPATLTGASLVFSLTVTDNNGATSTDTVTITVGFHSRWRRASDGSLHAVALTRAP